MPNPQEPPAADDVGALVKRVRELDKAAEARAKRPTTVLAARIARHHRHLRANGQPTGWCACGRAWRCLYADEEVLTMPDEARPSMANSNSTSGPGTRHYCGRTPYCTLWQAHDGPCVTAQTNYDTPMPNPTPSPTADDVGAIIARIPATADALGSEAIRLDGVQGVRRTVSLLNETAGLLRQLAAHVEALQADKRKMASAIRAMSVNLAGLRDELSQLAGAAAESADIAQRYDAAAGEMVPFPTSEGRADG